MTDYKIGYVILHYLTYDVTIECVEKVLNQLGKNDVIVIVDNGSHNKTGIKLFNKFKEYKNVHTILNDKNLGFAKGNNLGFKYLKDNYDIDLIVMINNDVLIEQVNWRNQLISIYNKEYFDLLGPEILDIKRNHTECNPQNPIHTTYHRVKFAKFMNDLKYLMSYVGLDTIIEKISNSATKNKETKIINKKSIKYNVQLAGCCWIFGKRYIDMFDGINPDTFLYLEEQILFYRIQSNNMKSMYSPFLEVVHLEDISTNALFKGKSSKRRFKYKCQRKSFDVLLNEIKKTPKKG